MALPRLDRRRPPAVDATAGSLSPNLRRLLQRMWRLRYGSISELHVRAGDPLYSPPFKIVRTARFTAADADRRAVVGGDFTLKREHIAFQRELAAIGDGVIDVVKVVDGLPIGLEITEQP